MAVPHNACRAVTSRRGTSRHIPRRCGSTANNGEVCTDDLPCMFDTFNRTRSISERYIVVFSYCTENHSVILVPWHTPHSCHSSQLYEHRIGIVLCKSHETLIFTNLRYASVPSLSRHVLASQNTSHCNVLLVGEDFDIFSGYLRRCVSDLHLQNITVSRCDFCCTSNALYGVVTR